MSTKWHSSVDPRVFQEKCLLGSRCFKLGLQACLKVSFHFSRLKFVQIELFLEETWLRFECSLSLQRTRKWSVWHSALDVTLV